MADMKFDVDYTSLKRANDELVRTGKVSKTSADAFSQAFGQVAKWQQQFIAQQAKVNSSLEIQYQKQNLANKSAKESANVFRQQAEEIERLSNKYRPLYAASKLYERSFEEINQAHKLGVITAQQLESQMERLNAEFQTGTGRFSTYANAMGKGANRAGVAMQQAGYQVGDFLVQVQSGTNPMVAFGQQATQLVGIMYLLPQATLAARVGIGALQVSIAGLALGLGIFIPLVTALGAAWMRTRKETDDSNEVLLKTADALKKVREETTDAAQALALLKSGFETIGELSLDQEIKNLQDRITALKTRDTAVTFGLSPETTKFMTPEDLIELEKKHLEDQAKQLENQLKPLEEQLALKIAARNELRAEQSRVEAINLFYENRAKLEEEQLAMRKEVARILKEAAEEEEERLRNIAEANGELSARVDLANAFLDGGEEALRQQENLQEQLALIKKLESDKYDLSQDEIDALVEQLRLAQELEQKVEEEREAQKAAAVEAKRLAEEEKKRLEEEKRRLAAVAEITAELTTQYNLAKVEAAHTKDSAEYRKAERTAIIAAAAARWDAAGATEAEKRIFSRLLLDSLDFEESIRNQADAAKEMAERLKEAASAMRDLSNFSVGLDQKLAVAAAEVAALKSGADAAVAGTITGLRFDLESKISAAEATGVDRGIIEKMFGPEREKLAQYGELLTEKGSLEDSKRGGDKETAEERLSALLKTAESERDLVGVEEERATQLRRAFTLTEQISEMEGGLTEERMKSIQTIVDLEAKTRLLQEAEERREAQIDEIVGHIRSAFDSLIDGTETVEEAFRKMMYNIAKSIWEQQVMDPLANAATSWIGKTFFGQANGGVWNNGVQMFANGGVVNSATPFRHAGGMGIMGEAGAEAIMPLKRGPDGKLGVAGGGNVTIHQNFNFAANGDESVKRIIAQEAPKIASMTQGQIMDARRRGGAMRNTFG